MTYNDLMTQLNTTELTVEWEVLSDIGPNWIGSIRQLKFCFENTPVETTGIFKQLENNIIERLAIPERSADTVINGHGKISLKNKTLKLDYEWDEWIPYAVQPEKEESGCTVIFP